MKRSTVKIWFASLTGGLLFFCAQNGQMKASDEEAREAHRQNGDLIAVERRLLGELDGLGRDITEIKQQMNTRSTNLAIAQEKSDKIRHELIVIHLKLLQ